MARAPRNAIPGMIFHVLNRATTRLRVFAGSGDYQAFEDILTAAHERFPMRIFAYCLMPTHWHMVVSPDGEQALSRCIQWLTHTHVQRWHAHKGSTGMGHVYQGRFRSFPVQEDGHFLTVCRYVERNALRAGLVERAQDWRWGSLWRRESGPVEARRLLSDWPVERANDWLESVNRAETEAELTALRAHIRRGRPYGDERWTALAARSLGLESVMRSRGRPRKGS
jgi:putative transposase